MYVHAVIVTVQQELGLYVLAHKPCPLTVKLLLYIKGLPVNMSKTDMGYYKSVLHSLCSVLTVGVCYDLFYELGLLLPELMETDGSAVFLVGIIRVLTAVKQKTPNASHAEGIIGFSVMYRDIVRHILGVYSSGVVISP